jgi:hypothetical protein
VASLSCAIRLEGVLLALLLLGHHAWTASRRRAAGAALAAGGIWAGLAAAAWSYYGEVIPHSVQAKWPWPRSGVPAVLAGLGGGDPVILIALAAGVHALATTRRHDPFARILALWTISWFAAFLAAGPRIWSWYAAPPCFAVLVVGSMGMTDILSRAPRRAWWPGRPAASAGAATAALAIWAGVLAINGPSPVTRHVHEGIRRWCQQQGSAADLIAARDIGLIGYHCGARIADLTGLVDREALRHATVESFVMARRPDYLLLNTTTSYRLIMRSPGLAGLYEPVARFSADGSRSLDPEAGLTRGYAPSYLLYARVKGGPT